MLGSILGVDCMMIRMRILLAVVGTAALCAPAAWADDWPQWGRDASRNMVSDEIGLPVSFSPGETTPDGAAIDMSTTRNVRWVTRLGTHTYGNPVVAGGKVIVGTNDASLDDPRLTKTEGGLILCFDAATGKKRWQLPVPRLLIERTPFDKAPFDAVREFGVYERE